MKELDMKSLLDIGNMPGMDFEDTPVVVYEPTVLVDVTSHPTERAKDLETDYHIAREALNKQMQMMTAMAAISLENAKNSESPKVVESFVKLMTAMTANTKEILRVHKEMEAITSEKTNTKQVQPQENSQGINIENATVFVGTPSELMLKEGTQTQAQSKNAIDGVATEVDGG